jgi:hypothetical protein
MNDEGKDWLDTELNKLTDLEAPETLLPRVMHVVRRKAGQRRLSRFLEGNRNTFRTLLVAFAVVALGALLLVNPIQYLGNVPIVAVPLKLASILLETLENLLLYYKIFNLPILAIILPAVIASLSLLVATATSVRWLAAIQK